MTDSFQAPKSSTDSTFDSETKYSARSPEQDFPLEKANIKYLFSPYEVLSLSPEHPNIPPLPLFAVAHNFPFILPVQLYILLKVYIYISRGLHFDLADTRTVPDMRGWASWPA